MAKSVYMCTEHDAECPICGYDGGAVHVSQVTCPRCHANWIWDTDMPYTCIHCHDAREAKAASGICPKCHTVFERPEHVALEHPGYFCPVCRARKYGLIGIVHFIPDANLNILPNITTA